MAFRGLSPVRGVALAWLRRRSARTEDAGLSSSVLLARAAARRQEMSFTAMIRVIDSVCRSSTVMEHLEGLHTKLRCLEMHRDADHATFRVRCPAGVVRCAWVDGDRWPRSPSEGESQAVARLKAGKDRLQFNSSFFPLAGAVAQNSETPGRKLLGCC